MTPFLGLLQKNVIYDLLKEILPLLYHPNQWITHSIVQLFTTISEHLSVIDLHCKVLPMISPFLARPLHSLANKYLILDSMHRPVSRHIFDIILDSKDSHGMFEGLRNKTANQVRHTSYKRLEAENIAPFVEGQLLALSNLLLIIHRNRRNYLNPAQAREEVSGQIAYNNYEKLMRSVNLVDSFSADDGSNSAANQEWQHMFGPRNRHHLLEEVVRSRVSDQDGTFTGCESAEEAKEVTHASIYFECPPCGRDVRALKQHKKSGFTPATVRPMVVGAGAFASSSLNNQSSNQFKPKGFLVAQLYEHKSAVNGLARYGNSGCFFTASDDGSLRLWDLANFESRQALNRSKWNFKMEFSNGAPINFKGVLACAGYVVTYTGEGMIYIFEPVESKLEHVCSFKPGGSGSGAGKSAPTFPLLITSLCALSVNVFAVSLTNSMIYGYDIRTIHSVNFFVPVFKVRLPPNQRTITAVDGAEVVLFAGTACGYIAGFDMRFNIKVNSFSQSSGQQQTPSSGSGQQSSSQSSRIAKLRYSNEGLYVSSYGSTDVTLWDYKTSERETLLRTAKPADGQAQETHSSVTKAILPLANMAAVITGGTDHRIRYWDLKQAENSYIISDPHVRKCHYIGAGGSKASGPHGKHHSTASGSTSIGNHYFGGIGPADHHHHHQHQHTMERMPLLAIYRPQQTSFGGRHYLVVEEVDTSARYLEESHNCIIEYQAPHSSHHDPITDLLNINQYLISSGRNGSVKVWR